MSLAVLHPDPSRASRLAELVDSGLIGRGVLGRAAAGRASERAAATGADRVFPVRGGLRPLLPWRGLRRGATVAVAAGAASAPAPGSASLLLTLLSEPVRAGSWCAVVGVPALGAAAAAELGVDLDRLVLVPDPGAEWGTVVATLLDGLDLVVVRPPCPVAPPLRRRLIARAKQRGAVLIPYGAWDGAEVTLRVTGQVWRGLGEGRGRLRDRQLHVVSYGRGSAARPRHARLWLPEGTEVSLPEAAAALPASAAVAPALAGELVEVAS